MTAIADRPSIPWAKPKLFGDEEPALVDALRSAWISGGPYVERLEREAAEAMRVSHVLAVANGTVALHLVLLGLDIGAGDEVIVPGFTFVAAANMVMAVGATPVYVDVDPQTWLLDPSAIDAVVTPRTKAVLPVHLYGNVADMGAIQTAADRYGIIVIEDAAEAAFSRYRGRYAGTMGTVGSFSLHATKTITTGEGGLVVTDDPALAARMRLIRDHGMTHGRRYWHEVIGYNFRLTNLQAALGCTQLGHLEEIIGDRARIHVRYRQLLESVPGITLQTFADGVDPVLWAMTARIETGASPTATRARRDAVIAAMSNDGIETRPGFYALSQMPPYDCPPLRHASEISASVISLPTFLGLSDDDIEYICDRLETHLSAIG